MNRKNIFGGSVVDNHNRVKIIVSCVALALSQLGAVGIARADSALGQNTTLGNAQNVAPVNPLAKRASGLDADSRVPPARTPTGQMYNIPYNVADEDGGPVFNSSVDVGLVNVGGDKQAAKYKEYKDVKSGIAVDSFSLELEKPDAATFLEVVGGGVGRDDQFYGGQFGKYNDWKVKAFYNETPHVFTTTAKPLWSGIGTGYLRLPSSMPAGGGVIYVGTNASLNQYCTGAIGTLCYVSSVYSSSGNATGTNNFTAGAPVAAAALTNATVTNGVLTDGGINVQATRAAIALQNAMGFSEIGLIRKNAGIGLDKTLSDTLKVFTTYTNEKRKGARPFAMVQGGGGGANNVETAEPIDYMTHDFKAGLRFADELTQFNLVASANLFRNNISSLVVDVPVTVGVTQTNALITQGRFALAPSNEAYDILAELNRDLPGFMNGHLTVTASRGSSRQNEALLPPTITQGSGTPSAAAGTFNGDFSQWNTTAALSEQTANARLDNKLVDVKLSLNPTKDLSVAAKYRYQGTDNKTTYLACNPNATYGNGTQYSAWGCTGFWGRMLNDGGGAAFVNTGTATSGLITLGSGTGTTAALPAMTGVGPVRNIPWDNIQHVVGLSGDYRLNRTSSANAAVERETVDRSNREVATTREDKFKIGYTNRAIFDGSLRLSAERDQKRGSGYNSFPYTAFTGAAFFDPNAIPAGTSLSAPYTARLADIHKLDVADRNQNILNGRVNYPVRADLDVGVNFQYKSINYPSNTVAGRRDSKQNSLGLDMNYQPTAQGTFYGFYSYQNATMQQNDVQNGVQTGAVQNAVNPAVLGPYYNCNMGQVTPWGTITPDTAAFICGTLSHNITFDPLKAWTLKSTDTNHVLGLGFKLNLAKNMLDINYVRSQSRTKIAYNYVDPAVAGENTAVTTAVGTTVVGYGMPDNSFVTNKLTGNFFMPITQQTTVRFLASYENGKSKDWHYPSSLTSNLILGTGASFQLDAGPQDYHVSTIGAMLQYKL